MRPFRTSVSRLVIAGLVLSASGLLAACGGDDDANGKAAAEKTAEGKAPNAASSEGTVTIGDQTFTFTTDVCLANDEDTMVSGPGKDADGEPVYVDLDATSADAGEVRIDIGTDEKFSSSDTILTAADHTGDFRVEKTGKDVRATGMFLQGDGSEVGEGTLAVTCS